MLTKRWLVAMRVRWRALAVACRVKLAAALPELRTNAEWDGLMPADKVEAFKRWFNGQAAAGVLQTDGHGEPWTNEYVHGAYKQGVLRAYLDTKGPTPEDGVDWYLGGQQQFLRDAFTQPETVRKLATLYGRPYEALKGVTATAASQMANILTTGLANGLHSTAIARQMAAEIEGLTKRRAELIAHHEIAYAHAEGQLDSFEKLGVEDLGILVEFSDSNDPTVCPKCKKLDGKIYKVKESHGIIPVHPRCRCAWLPADVGESVAAAKLSPAAKVAGRETVTARVVDVTR